MIRTVGFQGFDGIPSTTHLHRCGQVRTDGHTYLAHKTDVDVEGYLSSLGGWVPVHGAMQEHDVPRLARLLVGSPVLALVLQRMTVEIHAEYEAQIQGFRVFVSMALEF